MKASTSRGGGRREVGGEGDKQRTDLAEKQLEVTDELKNYISAINAPPSKPQSSKKKTGKDCDEPAGEDPRPASAAHVPPGLRGLARQD